MAVAGGSSPAGARRRRGRGGCWREQGREEKGSGECGGARSKQREEGAGREEQGEGECGGARGKQRERCKGDEGSQVCVRVCGQGMDKVRVCGGSRDPTVKRKDKVWLERKKARRMD